MIRPVARGVSVASAAANCRRCSTKCPLGGDHAVGLPVLRTLSLCACCRHYPGAASGRRLRSSHPAVSAFPERVVGSARTSAFSRLARRSLALRPAHSRRHLNVTCYTEGFSHFVTSMTAPVASGWSVSPGGTCTHWKAPPFTAHTLCCPSRSPTNGREARESGHPPTARRWVKSTHRGLRVTV
jgi:hypothetical protein